MPSWDLFDAQPQSYRDQVLLPAVHARLAVEAGASQGWHRYVGDRGDVLAWISQTYRCIGAENLRKMLCCSSFSQVQESPDADRVYAEAV
jgi:hypothetical protein